MNSRAQTILDYSIVSMIAGMILSTVSSQKIPSLLFYILIAASCLNWYVHYRKGTSTEGIELKQHKTLFILCSVSLVAVLLSKAVHLNMSGTEIEKAVRFSIGLPLLYAGLRFIPFNRMKYVFWGVYLGILFMFCYVVYLTDSEFNRPNTDAIHNAVSYAVIGLLLTGLALFSFGIRLTNKKIFEFICKTVTVSLGIITFVLLQTRTGILAIPILVFLMTIVFFYRESILKRLIVLLIVLGVSLGGLLSIPTMQKRVELAINEYNTCVASDLTLNTSICVRMQLSRAAWRIWLDQPWFGTGDNSAFQSIMKNELLPLKAVSQYTVNIFGEPHNDYLQNLSSFGVFGLIGLILWYFAPGLFFLKAAMLSKTLSQRCVAAMGASICLSFSLFSLTELMFRNMRTISFYVVVVAVIMAMLCVLRQENIISKDT